MILNSIGIGLLIGLLPGIIAFILPRKKTIAYGQAVYIFLGKLPEMLSKKVKIPIKMLSDIMKAITKTLVDFSFGIYLASEEMTDEQKSKEIEKYLK